jgi:hypothetical protein
MVARVNQACKQCAASKIKCTDSKPCPRCVNRNITCEVDCSEEPDVSPAEDGADLDLQDLPQAISDISTSGNSDLPNEHIEPQPVMNSEETPLLITTSQATTDSYSHSTVSCGFALPATPTSDVNDVNLIETSEVYADFLKSLLDNGSLENTYPVLMSAEDLGVGFWDDYLDANMHIEDTGTQNLSTPTNSNTFMPRADPGDSSRDMNALEQKAFRAAANAFEQSGWNWSPSSQDHRSAEHGGLSLPHDWACQEGIPLPDADFSAKQMGLTDRERVMGLLLTYCSKQHLARMVSTFPSIDSLNGLVHHFLRSQTAGWIHIPSFNPTSIRPELLAAVLAHGACSTPVDVMEKLGYAMVDIVRSAVIDNVSTRLFCLSRYQLTMFETVVWRQQFITRYPTLTSTALVLPSRYVSFNDKGFDRLQYSYWN